VKCKEFLKELSDYLDGSLDPKLQAELKEHLQWCSNCYVVCNTTEKTIEIYRENKVYELPDELRSKLQSAILSKCKGTKPLP
jgi:predicted anti-sigma-YlaC factor YlaD